MKTKNIIIGLVIIIVFLFGWYYYNEAITPGQYDEFAQCLSDKNVKYFGAFWCPNCQDQNKLFGKSKKFINYIECSTPNGQGQLQACIDAEIKAYPTWEFADGNREVGVQSLEKLSEKTGCELPR